MVHPAPGAPDGTLVNALLHHCGGTLSGIGGRLRPGIVHRIDKDTSGLLVVAKSDAAHQGLAAQFEAHDLERRYLAVACGAPDPAEPRLAGSPASPGSRRRAAHRGRIGRHPGDRKRMAVLNADGKPAVTRARVLERFPLRGRGGGALWSSAGWRPGGPTKSACTWPSPGIRWSGTASMAGASAAPACSRPFRGRRCTRRAWGSSIR